jgi:toxin FitB
MIILDTNVLSALMHTEPEPAVLGWLNQQPAGSIWISSVTVFEIEFGIRVLPDGKRRDALTLAFADALQEIGRRIVDFDSAASRHAAEVMATRRRAGRTVEIRDTMIAGIVLEQRASLATRNTQHFADLSFSVINPWADRS